MKWKLEKVEANKLLLNVRVWTETLGFIIIITSSHLLKMGFFTLYRTICNVFTRIMYLRYM